MVQEPCFFRVLYQLLFSSVQGAKHFLVANDVIILHKILAIVIKSLIFEVALVSFDWGRAHEHV